MAYNRAFGWNVVQRMLDGPAEVFELIVGRLPLADQANLAATNRALRRLVRPVMNGWVWPNPPVSLRQMLSPVGDMQWRYVLNAEQLVPQTYGYVACHWCHNIHAPTAAIDWEVVGFDCGEALRSTYEGGASGPRRSRVSLYDRPFKWHPLVLYAFVSWSQQGRDTSALRREADLDSRKYMHEDEYAESSSVLEWNAVWRVNHGLFIRRRESESFHVSRLGFVVDDCCPCGMTTKTITHSALHGEDITAVATSDQGTVSTVILDEADRRSATLIVGPVHGCTFCGVDFQAALTTAWNEEGKKVATMHWTTWYHLGNPASSWDTTEVLKDRSSRQNPAGLPLLGIGNVARLSELTDDYADE
ncbi:hypothetical protein PG996_013687 [Apiospora saccharicola]|uniref:F-box domain-containing protein n=1 Tax=Apiospora saccharicola TaxID=335842 RepID=A0ABR1U643_9PEZI